MNQHRYDLAVVGGGLAGFAAAVAAARLGVRTVLVQNRPVLGGNSSSEIRVPTGGACDFNPWARESGILEEFFLQERTQDPRRVWLGVIPSIWDVTLYDIARREKNLALLLNTTAQSVACGTGGTIERIHCFTMGNEKSFDVEAKLFVDATGDGTIGALAGAEFRFGREGKDELGEDLAPEKADSLVMGSSLLFHAEDVGRPVPFTPPDWVPRLASDRDLKHRTHDDITAGYWWIEVGNPPHNTITDNDAIRDELYRQLLAVWDHLKNQGDHGARNLHIDFIGAVPGKRESRRLVGDYLMRETDIRRDAGFPDAVAYGGWFCDLHVMGGILNNEEPPEPSFNNDLSEVDRRQMYTYTIPLRSLYSRNIPNLMMAGRDISVSHVALGSTRLMATCAVIGQAVGTTAAVCLKQGKSPREAARDSIGAIQQQLLKDDCYIPGIANRDPADLARTASVSASSSAVLAFPPGKMGHEYEHAKQKSFPRSELDTERAQLFPFTASRIDAVELELESQLAAGVPAVLSLYRSDSLTAFASSEVLAEKPFVVPARHRGYLKIELGVKVPEHSLLWIGVKAAAGVFWMYADNPPTGTVSATRIVKNWKPQKGSYSLRLSPVSRPYEAANLLSGFARPERWTNIWISDPEQPLPAWVEFSFGRSVRVNTVHLTFDTNLNMAHMSVPGLYRAPECVRDYRLLARASGGVWRELVAATGNFQRKRVHRFGTVETDGLRLEVSATNGSRSARLYQLRAYQED